ncbi:MAG: NADH-quinone oxidoreductase subunit NuoF [Deltaproteobacteria bacterium]|nr:NADH-quinone oxidoreductase subunit NuoF [Deltaproteobacteria bacterium]MBW1960028.1 NADH-quinone oxidoreductase subunit NuoF [Deltaproteobacteria bacterium]MBW2151220.1 NADH-quinone oxidoreductase subunit NuoF [Deltaproteobacteria bacterium]
MDRLSPETLHEIYVRMAGFLEIRFRDELPIGELSYPCHLLICGGTACHASKGIQIKNELEDEIKKKGIRDKVHVIETGCHGFCAQGPLMVVYPGGIFYQYLHPGDAEEIIDRHVMKGYPVERLMYRDPETGKAIPFRKDIPFFALQESRVLKNRGLIAAERIDEYIGTGGYQAACKALMEMEPEMIIAEVKESGLRGRGGAGFPTGLKWDFCAKSRGNVKYVLCNADEGDPGAFMDRSVLEANPHAVIEGMIIAAKAINAHRGYVYCRAEYPLAVKRLQIAIDKARQYGLLGKDILGSGFDFDLEIYRGAGAFVCGEETALITSIEGKRGMPRPRPPFPAVQGLWKKPTVLNNVETLSSIPQIILNGGSWYASIGTQRSKGTKVFALTGDVNNIGLVEVPMGMPLGTIIHDIGGGIINGKKFKAVQLGGPSGGCIPAQHQDTPVDYESITQLGAIVGSGGMIVMDEDKCMVDVARFFMEFCREESCGKCTPCRVGTDKMLEILTRICAGNSKEDDIKTLEKWAKIIQNTALCGLGQTAPNPVLSTLRYFRNEYEAHIHKKRCFSSVCRALVAYHALEDKCLPCLEMLAGYDAGGYEGLRAFLPELVPERLVTRIHDSGCAVDLARFSMMVPTQNKSCTKCTTCRLGSAQMLSILNDIATGKSGMEELELLFELVDTMKVASECPVGKTAPDIVLFTLENLRDQFEAHILGKACPYGICSEVVSYHAICPLQANEVV